MVDGIRDIGRPCTKADIAEEIGVTRQSIANHADELEEDARVEHGKVGTARAYWLHEWADSELEEEGGEDRGGRTVYSDSNSYDLDEEDEGGEKPPATNMGDPILMDYRAPNGETAFIDELEPEIADKVREFAADNDLSFEEAYDQILNEGAASFGVGPYSKSALEKIASPQTILGSSALMVGGVVVMLMSTFATSTPVFAFSLVVATVMIVLATVLSVLAALAQIALARPLRGLVGLSEEVKA